MGLDSPSSLQVLRPLLRYRNGRQPLLPHDLASRRSALFEADIETMEGAACFAVCKRFGVSGYQFRAVSNIATDRDTSTWKIEEALVELKRAVIDNI